MIESLNSFTDGEMGNIKANDLQFAISFDNENKFYLAFDIPELKEITQAEFIKSK